MVKIYRVYGQTGEYDDCRDWTVRCFTDRKKAEKFAEDAARRADEILNGVECELDVYNLPEGLNEFDLFMQMDGSGTVYLIEEMELEE